MSLDQNEKLRLRAVAVSVLRKPYRPSKAKSISNPKRNLHICKPNLGPIVPNTSASLVPFVLCVKSAPPPNPTPMYGLISFPGRPL